MSFYQSQLFVDRPGLAERLFPVGHRANAICFMAGDRQPFSAIAAGDVPNLNMFSADAVQYVTESEFGEDGNRHDNITDWALKQFSAHYKAAEPSPQPSAASGRGSKSGSGVRRITKEAIFHYCYAVLHDPVYRETYAQNLKR